MSTSDKIPLKPALTLVGAGDETGTVIELSFNGRKYLIALPDAGTDYIQGKIASERTPYELEMLKDMRERLSEGDLVLDIGANIGNHTLFLACVAGCRVVAFEPNKKLCEALKLSAELNSVAGSVSVRALAVGRSSSFGRFAGESPENVGAQRILAGSGDVEISALDDMAFDQPVKAMKIDVECMELDVLKGAEGLIKKDRPILYVECQQESDFRAVSSLLDSLGYSYWDTFNATPTHLFLPDEQVSLDKRLARLQFKNIQGSYVQNQELAQVRQRLSEANAKYRAATEQITDLNEKIAHAQADRAHLQEANEKYKAATEQIAALNEKLAHAQAERAQLQEANAKYKAATEKIAALNEKLAKAQLEHVQLQETNAKYKVATELIGSLRDKVAQAQADHKTLSAQITALKERSDALESEAARARELAFKAQARRLENEKELIRVKGQLSAAELGAQVLRLENEKNLTQVKGQLSEAEERLKASQRDLDSSRKEAVNLQERHKMDSVRSRIALSEAHAQAERLRHQLLAAQQKAENARATMSYQLGHALIFGFKSWEGLKSLPGRLWTLRAESKKRKTRTAAFFEPVKVAERVPAGPPALATQVQAPASEERPSEAPSLSRVPGRLQTEKTEQQAVPCARLLKNLKVASIMDEFTWSSYRHECNLLQLTPGNWLRELEDFRPDMLLIESAWRGKDELWGNKVGHKSQELTGIIQWCGERGIPTVFWNKEDPVHFETFLNTAKLFDYVFTTDMDCIHRYKAALGHERVYLLPFACQPASNNPIEVYERKDAFCFAGAYYVRYPERTRDLGNFLVSLPELRPVEIYDRNAGKNDPNYQFPPEYQPFIVGNLPFDQIDRAYKGYRYAINLNSIKQSQSMFARRVYDLLGSNTITVSNYSRGLRLMFGDLVLTSDCGIELLGRLRRLSADKASEDKLRLAALRKVMGEHSYQDRLAYVVSKVRGEKMPELLPAVLVLGYAEDEAQGLTIKENFERQSYGRKALVLVAPDELALKLQNDTGARVISNTECAKMRVADLGSSDDWLAVMVADDYYGPNYLFDLAVATRYAQTNVIGKAAHHVWSADAGIAVARPEKKYCRVSMVPARSAMARLDFFNDGGALGGLAAGLYTEQFKKEDALSIDEFNYCRNGGQEGFGPGQKKAVDDLAGLNTGVPVRELLEAAEKIAPEKASRDEVKRLQGSKIASMLAKLPAGSRVSLSAVEQSLKIDSSLEDGKHEYIYSTEDHTPEALGATGGRIKMHLELTPGLNVQLALYFLAASGQRIGSAVKTSNSNHEFPLPEGTSRVRLGLRVFGAGSACVNSVVLGHLSLDPPTVLGQAEHLLLTNHYPSGSDLYRNVFVHRRVTAYKEEGTRVDVFRFRAGEPVSYHEFENMDCITGSERVLEGMLSSGRYKSVLVHFLDEAMWEVLKRHIGRIKIIVWVHGAEFQPFHRRQYNYRTEQERQEARWRSERRMAFWRGILSPVPDTLKLVFVSRHFAEEAMEDLGFRLPESAYSIIHNPIDTELFNYERKEPGQRKKILSIRPYASLTYANDLSVKAILELSERPFFKELEFLMIGDGALFDETLAPLRWFENVTIEKRFLTQREIASLHKAFGIFLCPTRMDSQGVSRDEAMSSGLVPVTNAVAAVPEFVDSECGILAPAEDAHALAEGIAGLYSDPDRFQRMSERASERVRAQSSMLQMSNAELSLFAK